MNNEAYNARGFSPTAKTPVVRLNAKILCSSINMIPSVTNQGKVRFMPYRETMTAPALIRFMSSRLSKDVEKKLLLILDNLRVFQTSASLVRLPLDFNIYPPE